MIAGITLLNCLMKKKALFNAKVAEKYFAKWIKMKGLGQVEYPTRDVDRRRLLGAMFNLSNSAVNKFTCEELEEIAIKRGYIHKEPEPKEKEAKK